MHELSFGNQVRQDRRTAERVNDLIETIEQLAALVPPGADRELICSCVSTARGAASRSASSISTCRACTDRVKAHPATSIPTDGQFGLRDFSRATVRRRRDEGYRIARTCLSPIFASLGSLADQQPHARYAGH
jgi:hypothetical protein